MSESTGGTYLSMPDPCPHITRLDLIAARLHGRAEPFYDHLDVCADLLGDPDVFQVQWHEPTATLPGMTYRAHWSNVVEMLVARDWETIGMVTSFTPEDEREDLTVTLLDLRDWLDDSLMPFLMSVMLGASRPCPWEAGACAGDMHLRHLPDGEDVVCDFHEFRVEQAWEMHEGYVSSEF